MKVSKLIAYAFFALMSAGHADPGGWVSSGGEIFRFAKNPWFVKNVSQVKYCVQIDPVGFSADGAVVRASIDKALKYWANEFAQARGPSGGGGGLNADPTTPLATQVFTEVACDADTDVVFKMGDGSLTAEDKTNLENFRSYIGVTVRTDYDTKLMKGKGFIFIASDRGPNAYENPGHLIDQAWQFPKLLDYLLLHELGHVFGLPHSGVGLMSEVFADQLLHKTMYKSYMSMEAPSMFGSARPIDVCPPFATFDPTFFQMPISTKCLRAKPDPNDPFYWEISTLDKTGTADLTGYLRLQPSGNAFMSLQPAVLVHLPPDQQAFSPSERALFNFLVGAFYMDLNAPATYRTKSSLKPYAGFVQMRPDRINILAETNGKMGSVLEYSPPTLFRLLFPPK